MIESAKKSVLVIDDNDELRKAIAEALNFSDYNVLQATNGFSGIEMVKMHKPDIILCDIMMPEIDGYGVKQQLANDPETILIPFVFLTAVSDTDDVRKGMEMGADDYLIKPVSLNNLLGTVKSRLDKSAKLNEYLNKKIDRFKSTIIRVLPHEFLTPLNSIIGFSSIIKDNDGNLSRSEIKEFAAIIEESGNRLYKMIDNYLQYSKMLIDKEAEAIVNEVKTSKLINEISRKIAAIHKRPDDLVFELSESALRLEESDFEYILEEIIGNAFKFSPVGSPVKIATMAENDKLIITVTDNGIGFPVEHLGDIGAFNQFNRNENEQQGAGLGLVTAMLVVQRYNGKLSIRRLNRGTEVEIIFPL
ncbi:MAG: response regulator [Draconibacterium sp.]